MAAPGQIVEIVRSVIGGGTHLLHAPYLCGKEQEYVSKVIQSGHLSAGKWVTVFEDKLASFVGARHAIAVTNGTCGLHAAITVLYRDKKKLRIPSLTFVATANAVAYGGHEIEFVEHDTYGDVVVDVMGHPHFNIGCPLRDAAQALGSKRYGEYVGQTGTAVFSFNQNKIITTGGGGMVVTDDEDVAKAIRHLVTTARVDHPWETAHNAVAFNYRMSDVTAAIGVAQMEQLPIILQAKRALAMKYKEAFLSVKGVTFWDEAENAKSNFWLNAIILEDESVLEPCLQALHGQGIQARPLWEPIHRLPMYAGCARDGSLDQTEKLARRVICLPSSPHLGMRYL